MPSNEKEINENEVGLGIDEKGFWHFMCHSKKDIHSVIGFLEMAKDAVKVHYMGQLRADAAIKKGLNLIRPDIAEAIAGRFKR